MPTKRTHIYLLPTYANPDQLADRRGEHDHESKITYPEEGKRVTLSETKSFIEERYCLRMFSSIYIADEVGGKNEEKEMMIHHHPYGHSGRHLQFTLQHEHKTIRVNLEPMDEEDYTKCIKGFLHISQDLLHLAQEENQITINLVEHFFNKKIKELTPFRGFLLSKVKTAFQNNNILNESDEPITADQLDNLRENAHLLLFFKWES